MLLQAVQKDYLPHKKEHWQLQQGHLRTTAALPLDLISNDHKTPISYDMANII